jgi:nucleotide-binding universal stress UspA family protein
MFKTIVWATDGSANADRALPCVRDVAETYSSSLRVVHVVEKVGGGRLGDADTYLNEDRTLATLRSQTSALRRHGFDASLHLIRGAAGQPARQIAATAAQVGADLVIVGTRGRSPVAGALLGSVTQRLLHITTCPVLVVPSPSRAGAEPVESPNRAAALPAGSG